MSNIYKNYGVSSSKEEVHEAIKVMKSSFNTTAFCQAVDIGDDYYHIMHADGAGTKSILAYLNYMEKGDPSIFEGLAVDSIIMNTDDMLCVGLVDNFIVSNTIGRNAKRIPQEVLTSIMLGYQKFCDLMSDCGINIQLCGGETADVGDLVNTVVVDSTAYGKILKSDFIDAGKIDPSKEMVIVGLASFGQSTYEQSMNSGIGSNGFTVIRHEVLCKKYSSLYPETFSSSFKVNQVYSGAYGMLDYLPDSDTTISELLLSPCRTYLPIMKEVFLQLSGKIYSVIHNTGGGLIKSINFGKGVRYVKNDLFKTPNVFNLIREKNSIPFREMWSIFNSGHRLEVCCSLSDSKTIIDIAKSFNVEAKVIGYVEPSNSISNEVFIKHEGIEELYFGRHTKI